MCRLLRSFERIVGFIPSHISNHGSNRVMGRRRFRFVAHVKGLGHCDPWCRGGVTPPLRK